MTLPRPVGIALPAQPDTLGALRAMQSIVLNECLIGGVSPFAALSATDADRYGVARAIFIGEPKDFKDVYLPQCAIWIPAGSETLDLESLGGRASATFAAEVEVYVDLSGDWYAAEQQVLAIRDALWPALLRHERLGGSVPSVAASLAREGRGLGYTQVAGVEYRTYAARWEVRQQWSASGGRVL